MIPSTQAAEHSLTTSSRAITGEIRYVEGERPGPEDLAGEFDFWFDGGACRQITGYTEYQLADGTVATNAVTPGLSLSIQFPDGRRVGIREHRP